MKIAVGSVLLLILANPSFATPTERQKMEQELAILTRQQQPLRARAEKTIPVQRARADLDAAFRRYYETLHRQMIALSPKSKKNVQREQQLRQILKTSGSRANP
jgi:hypothetical protein